MIYHSPYGQMTIVDDGHSITQLYFGAGSHIEETPLTVLCCRQLDEYFQKKRTKFDLPLNPKGTEFQKKVWSALSQIPYGKTVTYSYIAEKVGNPKASRAVGMANHNNPIAIIIPCHRVIGKNNAMTGYAGGIEMKEQLLALEKGL